MKKSPKKGSETSKNAKKPAATAEKTGTTRRNFLMSSAASAGLLLGGKTAAEQAAPAAAPAIASRSREELNVAIIGCGAQGFVLMESMLRIPGIRFQAVCDIWEDYSLRRAHGTLRRYGFDVNTYIDYRELLEKEQGLDAAIIATPDFVHAEQTIACLEAGLHVYCEKEMSNCLESARQMVMAANRTQKLLQIGHQRRSNPRYIHAVENVIKKAKLLGTLTQGFGQWNRAKSDDIVSNPRFDIPAETLAHFGFDSMQHFNNWRWYKKYGGGPIVDLGSHQIDIFTWVYGTPPKSVTACGGTDYYGHHEWYDNVMAIFDYDTPQGVSRAFYQVLTTSSVGGYYERFGGTEGSLVISELPFNGDWVLREETVAPMWDQHAKNGLIMPEDEEEDPIALKGRDIEVDVRVTPEPGKWPLPVVLNKPAHQPHLENFFDAIRIGVPLTCDGQCGYETAVAVLKVNEAVAEKRMIEFKPGEFVV